MEEKMIKRVSFLFFELRFDSDFSARVNFSSICCSSSEQQYLLLLSQTAVQKVGGKKASTAQLFDLVSFREPFQVQHNTSNSNMDKTNLQSTQKKPQGHSVKKSENTGKTTMIKVRYLSLEKRIHQSQWTLMGVQPLCVCAEQVVGSSGKAVSFEMSKDTLMRSALDAYAKKVGKERHTIRWVDDTRGRLSPPLTPRRHCHSYLLFICVRQPRALISCRFRWAGVWISNSDTPGTLNMEDNGTSSNY